MTSYERFVLEMLTHCFLYYQMDDPAIEDSEYDQLYKSLRMLEDTMEDLGEPISPYSPTQMVGFDYTILKSFMKEKCRLPDGKR